MPPDPVMLAWLWSPEGLAWSKAYIKNVRHGAGLIAEIKNDHECSVAGGVDFCPTISSSPYPDGEIRDDLKKYGISGVPLEWKRRLLGSTYEPPQEPA